MGLGGLAPKVVIHSGFRVDVIDIEQKRNQTVAESRTYGRCSGIGKSLTIVWVRSIFGDVSYSKTPLVWEGSPRRVSHQRVGNGFLLSLFGILRR